MQPRKKVNIDRVEIGTSRNGYLSDREGGVVIIYFTPTMVGIGNNREAYFCSNSSMSYNDFIDSSEFKSLHPEVLMRYSDSQRTELSSHTLKSFEIIEKLKQNFDSLALDAFNVNAYKKV